MYHSNVSDHVARIITCVSLYLSDRGSLIYHSHITQIFRSCYILSVYLQLNAWCSCSSYFAHTQLGDSIEASNETISQPLTCTKTTHPLFALITLLSTHTQLGDSLEASNETISPATHLHENNSPLYCLDHATELSHAARWLTWSLE